MADAVNLKAVITSDTSGFVKGAKQVKDDLKNLDKVSNDTLSKLGDMFGINVEQVNKLSSAVSGLGEKLSRSGNEGASSFGKLLTSVDKLSVGIAAIGISGIVAGFKLLNEEAEAFKTTIEGANLALQTSTFISTYQQVLRDIDSSFGKTTAAGMAETEKWYKKLWALSKNTALNTFTGKQPDFGSAFAAASFKNTLATGVADKAWEIQGRINDATTKQLYNLEEIAKYDAVIAEQRAKAVDPEYTIEERLEAQKAAAQAIADKYALQISAQQELVNAMQELHELATDNKDAETALVNAKVTLSNLTAQQANEDRALLKLEKSLTAEANKQAAAASAAAKEKAKMAAMRSEFNNFDLSISAATTENLQKAADAQIGKDLTVESSLKLKADKESAEQAMADFAPIIQSGLESLGSSLGELFANLATGEDAWGNFSNSAISAFGDMAIAVGKMAIATGTATLGIKAALESLNGYVAIAAGVALVALGAAVKQGMSNIASGNYSSSSNVASSGSYSSTTMGDYSQREIDVNISGTFTASGNSLVAVLDNENKRKNHTC